MPIQMPRETSLSAPASSSCPTNLSVPLLLPQQAVGLHPSLIKAASAASDCSATVAVLDCHMQ